jgi:hypothetical protein
MMGHKNNHNMLHDVNSSDVIRESPNHIDIEDERDFMYIRFVIMLYKNIRFTEVLI